MRWSQKFPLSIIALNAVLIVTAQVATPQLTRESFQDLLIRKAGMSEEELSALNRGETVVKILPVKLKQEIAVFGIVRLKDFPSVSMQIFRDSLDQNGSSDYSSGGKLSMPPTIQDLVRLRFEDRDLEDLKTCVVGRCNVKLPASMIRSLNEEVDWSAPDHKSRATNRLKQFLVEYGRDYLQKGDAALIEYVDKRKSVKVADVYPDLIGHLQFLDAAAPEFAEYLLGFPKVELQGAENTLDWSKVRSGLKPVISMTHGTSFAKKAGGTSWLFVATKQLYANHYVDASFTLASLAQFGSGDTLETYLTFDNRSRSDALAGIFGDMVRGLTEAEAQRRVMELLQRSDQRIETRALRPIGEPEVAEHQGFISWSVDILKRRAVLIAAAFAFVAFAALLAFRWRR